MDNWLASVTDASVLSFVVACMFAAGLELTVANVLAPLRRWRLVMSALVANFIMTPALAYGLVKLFPIETPYAVGLLLLGGAAGAPFLPKLAVAARGDMAFSVGLMLLLMVASVVYMPIALPLLIPGLSAEPWPILKPLLFTMLLPLAVGMLLRGRIEAWAVRLQPCVKCLSNVSAVLTLVLLIGRNFSAMLATFGSGAVALATLFVALAFGIGYLAGTERTRSVLGLGTGQRNVAAALLIATQNYSDPRVVVMLLTSTIAGLVVLLIVSVLLRRSSLKLSGSN